MCWSLASKRVQTRTQPNSFNRKGINLQERHQNVSWVCDIIYQRYWTLLHNTTVCKHKFTFTNVILKEKEKRRAFYTSCAQLRTSKNAF